MMLESINNMRVVAELCRAGRPIPDGLADWLATSLQSYLDQRCGSLNEAFGLRRSRGGVPWRLVEGIRIRDAALRNVAERHFCDLTVSAQASSIYQLSLRYAASNWQFDREADDLPNSYRGGPKEFLWLAFKSGAAMPLGLRQLRTILSGKYVPIKAAH